MKEKKNTKRLEEFKAACLKEVDRLNLKDWTIFFESKNLNGKLAEVEFDTIESVATVRLDTKKEDEKYSIKKLAKHEMLHLLMARMDGLATEQQFRNVHEDEINKEEHRIVRILEKCLPELP